MKTARLFIVLLILFRCQAPKDSFEIVIENIKSFEKFNENCNNHFHKENDVEIFTHITENGNYLYSCTIYKLNNDTIRAFRATAIDIHNYDQAAYKWVNDSSLTFTFKNKYIDSKKYTITGYISKDNQRTTSLSWED